MIAHPDPGSRRHGLTLLEVLVALSIFLLALIGIGKLITLGAEQALNVAEQARAAQLCQAKLAEVVAGAVPLSGQADVPFDEDSAWMWSLDASQGDVSGLWKIKVTVSRQRSDGSRITCSFDRMLLDPSLRGSALDAQTIAANSTSNSSSNSSSSSSSTSSTPSTSGASSSGAGASSGGGAAKSSSGGGAASTPSSAGSPSGAGSSSSNKGTTKGGN
jgi:prepilin-type N-terminal cleavage/methylation domain-containing protein